MDTDSFIVYIERDYIYKNIVEDVETRFDTSRLGWCPYLLLRIITQATKTDMQDCCSFTCYLS